MFELPMSLNKPKVKGKANFILEHEGPEGEQR
jgi:hypothetical protein